MTPLVAILSAIILAQGVFITYFARRLLSINRAAAYWQQQAGDNARDAIRWRLHIQHCARGGKTAAQHHRGKVYAMTARLREGL